MTLHNRVLQLQSRQKRHDEGYHPDILALGIPQRLKHMTLHHAKYAGRFLAATEDGEAKLFSRTLTDAFIISLSTANSLVQDLTRNLPPVDKDKASLQDLGITLAAKSPNSGSFVRVYATHTSAMAKACESLDHLEDYPFRKTLTESNEGIFCALLKEAAVRQIDIEAAYTNRIEEVEAGSPCTRLADPSRVEA